MRQKGFGAWRTSPSCATISVRQILGQIWRRNYEEVADCERLLGLRFCQS
jgi:hypothetical protein